MHLHPTAAVSKYVLITIQTTTWCAHACAREERRVRTGGGADGVEQRRKGVGRVVGEHAGEDGGDALKAHAGVNVLRRQVAQAAACLAVVLDEHHVPDLEDVGVILVDELGDVAAAEAVVVDLRARPARPLHVDCAVAAQKNAFAPHSSVCCSGRGLNPCKRIHNALLLPLRRDATRFCIWWREPLQHTGCRPHGCAHVARLLQPWAQPSSDAPTERASHAHTQHAGGGG